MQLLIMAAGMGSRFGGLKQVAPMGPNDEFIIDYSIYDAIKAGFSKVVFIIKEENYDIFKESIGSRVEPHIPVEYVFQKLENVPEFVQIPETRQKPWGTAHAIYCAKDAITEPFLVINADDFYGRDAFMVAKEFLEKGAEREYATIGYEAIKTMTENGSVKRGVIFTKDGQLDSIVESSIIETGDKITCTPLDGREEFTIEKDASVSMNMLLFEPTLFAYLDKKIVEFFKKNENDLEKCEYLLPNVVFASSLEENNPIRVITTDSKYLGMTYREDLEDLKNGILKYIEDGIYKNDLWG